MTSDTLTATIAGLDLVERLRALKVIAQAEGFSRYSLTTIDAALEALANRGADKEAEPVAWTFEVASVLDDGMGVFDSKYRGWVHHISTTEPVLPSDRVRNIRPLYASPPTSTAEPVRVRELAWEREYTDHGGYVSVTAKKGLIGVYDVYRLTNESQWHLELAGAGIGLFDTQELAQAAAQEHYSNAIRSALEPEAGA